MPYLQLESARFGVLPLNGVLTTDLGVEALSGVTGLGLPPVSLQWREGAGDGAVFRSKRNLQRTIDIPIYVASEDRDGLKDAVRDLARILTREVTIRWMDEDGSSWWVKAHRSGGFDFTYGLDTIGEDELLTTISFQTGSSYWTASSPITKTYNGTAINGINEYLENEDGDADAPCTWTITGPVSDITLIGGASTEGGDKEQFQLTGTIASGARVRIDTEEGTVYDPDNTNQWSGTYASKYALVKPGPQFWSVRPGGRWLGILASGLASAGSLVRTGRYRTQYVTNGTFEVDTSGWVQAAILNDPKTGDRAATFVRANDKPAQTGSFVGKLSIPATFSGWCGAGTTITGLTVGQTYVVGISWLMTDTATTTPNPVFSINGTTKLAELTTRGAWTKAVATFVAEASSVNLIVFGGTPQKADRKNHAYDVWIDSVLMTERIDPLDTAGTDYRLFDGAGVIGATSQPANYDYAWLGTPYASQSREYEKAVLGSSKLELTYYPRKALVI